MHEVRITAPLVAALVLAASGVARLHADSVQHLPLRELVTRADRIVRGIVIEQDDLTIAAGGGQLPATRYRIRVDDALKGAAKAGQTIEVTLLARPRTAPASTSLRRGPVLQDLPQFQVGREYLFLLTRPSAIGLSTTVGLRQGLFELRGRGDDALAVNGAGNVGLLERPQPAARTRTAATPLPFTSPGPLPYATLASEIRALAK